MKHKDPRWQKKRLEILDRDEFTCLRCGSKEKTLHVHHKRYCGDLWRSPDEDLQTLCEDCHKELGKHPKGGIYWQKEEYEGQTLDMCVFDNCPVCGCEEFRDKGGTSKCADCGHPLVTLKWGNCGISTGSMSEYERQVAI